MPLSEPEPLPNRIESKVRFANDRPAFEAAVKASQPLDQILVRNSLLFQLEPKGWCQVVDGRLQKPLSRKAFLARAEDYFTAPAVLLQKIPKQGRPLNKSFGEVRPWQD